VSGRSTTQQRYLERAARAYHEQLWTSQGSSHDYVNDYLIEHAITRDMVAKYRLGVVAKPLDGDARFYGALVYPYCDRKGVSAIRFRLFDSNDKIGQHSGQKSRIYHTAAFFEAEDEIGIAEGEPDTIASSEHILPTVGIPGVKNYKDRWTSLFKDYTKVYIFAQGDQRGREFGEQMSDTIGWRARVINCPDREDVASLAAKGQVSLLTRLMSTSNDDGE
jgi:hypothetical protein